MAGMGVGHYGQYLSRLSGGVPGGSSSPRLPPISPRLPAGRDGEIRRLQQLNLTPRLGGAGGRIGVLHVCAGQAAPPGAKVARGAQFTLGFTGGSQRRLAPPLQPKPDEETLAARRAALMAKRQAQRDMIARRDAEEQELRAQARRRRIARRHNAARVIQHSWRGFGTRKALSQLRQKLLTERELLRDTFASQHIQSSFRGRQARKSVNHIRAQREHAAQVNAAIYMQACWRMLLRARRRLRDTLNSNDQFFEHMRHTLRDDAARMIQRNVRAKARRRNMPQLGSVLDEAQMMQAARTIQRVTRTRKKSTEMGYAAMFELAPAPVPEPPPPPPPPPVQSRPSPRRQNLQRRGGSPQARVNYKGASTTMGGGGYSRATSRARSPRGAGPKGASPRGTSPRGAASRGTAKAPTV